MDKREGLNWYHINARRCATRSSRKFNIKKLIYVDLDFGNAQYTLPIQIDYESV